ncbi:villin headpiece domain containing protein [Nitzschia inconspicua]|uniref:Villin headpiece domain containing protein n=1 Tax=Nitzschia inconspicua TaxID=303405 RepID=A0A9K3LZY2_9STRA|nr:villin headpiece domain containing protein [Nitzschia inconspicua]KAG7371678.1 villin headpiece domain containing protein [Nitzschia inconspicua]
MHSPVQQRLDDDADAAAAKRRIEEEMAKIQATTQQKRVQKMKTLVGEQASPVKDRKGYVQLSHEQFVKRGTLPEEKKKPDLEELLPEITTEHTVAARKQAYATKLEEFSNKGREHFQQLPDGHESLDVPFSSSSSLSSPVKEYKAIAAANATKSSGTSVGPPTLFAYDPVKDANQQASSKTKGSSTGNINNKNTTNALTPKNWDGTTFYTLIDLRQRRVPKDIDWKNREQYLSDADFQQAFGMSKNEFAVQPKWKRDKLKQGLYLF